MQLTQLGALELKSPVMNAAGPWSSDYEQLLAIQKTNSGATETKTFTLDVRLGNKKPTEYYSDDFSLNSVGVRNMGAEYFIKASLRLNPNKPLIANVAEDSSEQLGDLLDMLDGSGFYAANLNLSCPNTDGEPVASRPHLLYKWLRDAREATELPLGIKLPPYTTRTAIEEVATVIANPKFKINHIVTCNTFPLALELDHENFVVTGKEADGIGGLGGKALKQIALAQVALFRKFLPEMPIVGVGGIENEQDVRDFMRVGAQAVQIGTAIQNHGLELLDELAGIDYSTRAINS